METPLHDPGPPLPLFVYGTLRWDCCPDTVRPLRVGCRSLGPAVVQGTLFDLGDYPGLILEAEGGIVHGELLLWDDTDAPEEILRRLDRYEGCDPANPSAGLYRRERAVATLERDGSSVDCWVYVYNHAMTGARRIDSGCWRSHRDH